MSSKMKCTNFILMFCALLCMGYGEYLEPGILIIRNGTEWNLNQTHNGVIIIDIAPFDFFYGSQSVLFVNDTYIQQSIERRHFYNDSDTQEITSQIYEIASIQYDWKHRNIYLLHSNIVEVIDITGTYRQTLYWEDMEQVNYMVIDPDYGYIFWCDGGTHAKIERAGMHGDDTSRDLIITEDIQQPFGLAKDSEHRYLYWSDTFLRVIGRCSYDGSERKTLMELYLQVPGHISYSNGTIYWIEQVNQTLNAFSISSELSKNVAKLPTELLQIDDKKKDYKKQRLVNFHVQIYDELSHEKAMNNLIGFTNKCHHLSLSKANSSQPFCKCSAYYNMTTNDGRCIEEEEEWKVLFSYFGHGISQIFNGSTEEIFDKTAYHIVLLNDKDILFTLRDELYTSNLDNITAYKSTVHLPFLAYTYDLEYDWIGDTLYWAINDVRFGFIFTLKLRSEQEALYSWLISFRREIIHQLELDVSKQLIFVLVDRYIGKAAMDFNLDTYNVLMNFTQAGRKYLTVDREEQIIYVSVMNSDRFGILHRCTYSGNKLEDRYEQYTGPSAFIGRYRITTEQEGGMYVTIVQSDKRFNGNRKNIFRKFDNDYVIGSLDIYPENRKYSGVHPCQINNGNCSQMCLITFLEPFYTCKCGYPFKLAPDGITCVSHPCDSPDNGNCSMDCFELGGLNYTCGCSNGFQLASDGKRCIGKMGITMIELVDVGWRQIDLSSKKYTTIYTYTAEKMSFLQYDPIEQNVYYFSTMVMDIIRQNLYGTDKKIVISHVEKIEHFSLDWLSRDIYWLTKAHFRRLDMNLSESQQLSREELFFDVLEYSTNELKPFTEKYYFYSVDMDVFNGLLYCVFKQREGLLKMYSFQRSAFTSTAIKHRPVYVTEYENEAGATLAFDTLHNRVFFTASIGEYQMRSTHLYVCNSDGTGYETVSSNLLVSAPLVFDKYIYVLEYTHSAKRILKILNRANLEIVNITDMHVRGQLGHFSVTGANLHTTDTVEDVDQCKDYQLCWSNVNAWTCIEPQQICDGVNDCYEGHDEHYCFVCTHNCTIVSFKISCYQSDFLHSDKKENNGLFEFINWNENPVSKLLTLQSILSYDCFIRIEMESSSQHHLRNMEISSLYRLHKLRQTILSPMFRNLSGVLEVDLSGEPLLSGVHPTGIGIFENVRSLKVENSLIGHLPYGTFRNTSKLTSLIMSDNHLLRSIDGNCFIGLTELKMLSLTGSNLGSISGNVFVDLLNLTSLNLSSNNIKILGEGIFNNLEQLLILDIRKNTIKLTSELFLHTNMLQMIYCDSFTVCCIKPPSVSDDNCTGGQDDISSCHYLIENRILALFLWLFGIMAFCGNLVVLLYRGFIDKSIFTKSYFIFIYNLGLSDLIMSVYMMIIAIHDAIYNGIYVWNDYPWKQSILCSLSGMLAMVSSEASMMFVTLITLERFFCVKFAFGTVKISRKNAIIVSIVVWLFASFLSVIPIIFYPEFYSRSGVCIGIPLTRENDTGLAYSTFVFLGLNFLLCAVIPFGQYYILDEVKKSSAKVQSTQKGRNFAVAKRLAVVVMTDCLCWLPVGILVILSLAGVKTTRDIYAWVIIFVLPINAALNPYIYTLTDVSWDKVKQCLCWKNNDAIRSK